MHLFREWRWKWTWGWDDWGRLLWSLTLFWIAYAPR